MKWDWGVSLGEGMGDFWDSIKNVNEEIPNKKIRKNKTLESFPYDRRL